MPLTEEDRALIQRCLNRETNAWNDFVDRFLGLIYHVVHYTAHARGVTLRPEETEDIAAEVLVQLVAHDFSVLRQFRGQCDLATYLTVVTRRGCLHELNRRTGVLEPAAHADARRLAEVEADTAPAVTGGLETLEEVQKLLRRLPARERQVVRLFYIEGHTYEEISTVLNIPVNSIGPILSRSRKLLASKRKVSEQASESNPAPAPRDKPAP
ncbi:MAG: RNA polymerase sigma factor [Gemmataceae bacterium]